MEEYNVIQKDALIDLEICCNNVIATKFNYLRSVVAGLCDVDPTDMLSSNRLIKVVQARALFFYAYKYLTNETNESIAEMVKIDGCKFTHQNVCFAIKQMSNLIDNGGIWGERWKHIKQVIKFMGDEINEKKKPQKIVVNIPSNLDIEIVKQKK